MHGVAGVIDLKSHFMFSRSRYGNRDTSIVSNPYNGSARANVLLCGIDAAEKARLQQEAAAAEAAFKEAQELQKVD